ncbi:siroheme synthase CysG [Candidatus Pantoea carbekii]|uniref:Siroheme synthase n=1 Tax=Candidatus Pantoea carbekii TaxID=1235990 RepID=U3U219_9GAMM|nr:siroheme synthase CysG [Candidatus Pantoea carbekii]BAO00141.1 CysG protein [Candidatus Pantoea carbekii]
MDYLPLFMNLKNRSVLVVGGGNTAARKVKFLHRAGALIQIVAHKLGNELQALLNIKTIKWIAHNFDPIQLDNVFLVIAATDNHDCNKQIFEAANSRYKFVNVVDDQKKCNFIFPSIVDRSPFLVAISSSGTAPVLARLLREKIESLLPANFGQVAEIAGQWRETVKKTYRKISERRHFWEDVFNGLFTGQIINRKFNDANSTLKYELAKHRKNQGQITLVGAGPGDSGLLTLRGLQVMQLADVVLYDYLVSDEVLELIRRDAERICVGKRAGEHSISQNRINKLLVKLAQEGKRVVRLKNGDPFIFGRGGEELQAAQIAGIPFQVVPGITSGIGVTAYAGIPLTHREFAHSVLFITGQCCANRQEIHWPSLTTSFYQTIVIYMGTLKAREIKTALITYGRDPITPVAVISCGTRQNQQVLIGTLKQLDILVATAPKPSILIIGEVVKLHKRLAWF